MYDSVKMSRYKRMAIRSRRVNASALDISFDFLHPVEWTLIILHANINMHISERTMLLNVSTSNYVFD